MDLPLPSSDAPLDSPGLVSGTQAAQVSQPAIGIPKKRKIKDYKSSDSIPSHKAHRLIPSNDTQVTTEP